MLKRFIKYSLNLGFSQTAKSVYWVFSGNVISVLMAFFTTVLIARYLSKEEFGLYLALYTFASLLADLGDAGIGSAMSNFLPPLLLNKNFMASNLILGSAFYLELIFGMVILLITSFSSPLIAKYMFNNINLSSILIAIFLMLVILLTNFSIFALSAQKKFKESTLINVIAGIIRLVLLFIITITTKLNLNNVLIIYLISFLCAWIYSLFLLKIDFIKFLPQKETVKKLLHFSGFLSLQKILITISSRLDMLMLVPLAGNLAAGIYGAASRISQIYPFFISSFGLVTAPKYAEFTEKHKALNFFVKTILVILLFLISILFLYVFADKFIIWLFPKYFESIRVFRVILLSMFGFVLAAPFTTILIYTIKKPKIVAIASGISLLLIFVGNLIFIPKYHEIGPAISIGIGNLVVFLICGFSVWYYYKNI